MPSPRSGKPEAAATIWSWRVAGRPSHAALAGDVRRRGVRQAVVGAVVGTALYVFVSRRLGGVALVLTAAIGTSALLSPLGVYAALERAFAALGRGVGRGLTWIMLPAIFFLFFAPFAALFRRGRRDSMQRYFDPQAPSYWSPRDTPAPARASQQRTRQY